MVLFKNLHHLLPTVEQNRAPTNFHLAFLAPQHSNFDQEKYISSILDRLDEEGRLFVDRNSSQNVKINPARSCLHRDRIHGMAVQTKNIVFKGPHCYQTRTPWPIKPTDTSKRNINYGLVVGIYFQTFQLIREAGRSRGDMEVNQRK